MHQHYHPWLVLVSLLVAILAAYTALTLALRIRVASKLHAPAWLIGGGIAMGIGIWAMHYVGMAAIEISPRIQYDPSWVAISFAIAIAASLAALGVAFTAPA